MTDADLAQRNRELELIYRIDRLRDTTPDEADLVGGITSILMQELDADLCLIILAQPDRGELVIRSLVDRRNLPPQSLDQIRAQATTLSAVAPLPTPDGISNLFLLGGPLIIVERIGALVLGRSTGFLPADETLLQAAISQIDSAIIHSRSLQQLRIRNRELELIYTIDRIRDQERDLDVMLQRVLVELCGALIGEVGFIALYDESQETQLQLKVATESAPIAGFHYDVIHTISSQAIRQGAPVFSNAPAGHIRSLMAVPLILREKIIGVVGALDSKRHGGFSEDDRRLLSAIASQLDTAILERKEQRRLRSLLTRAVDPKVIEHLMERTDVAILAGDRVELTVLFADLRGSTAWEERTDPDELVNTLNRFYERMTNVIFEYDGTLDKFAGDQVIALFGTPLAMPDHAHKAVRAGIAMQTAHRQLQDDLRALGRALPPIGIGINSGIATAGEFGTRLRTEFTAIGPAVNLCARLCGAAAGNDILLSADTYAHINGLFPAEPLTPLALRGVRTPVQVYRIQP
jgi:adenylate cyclase